MRSLSFSYLQSQMPLSIPSTVLCLLQSHSVSFSVFMLFSQTSTYLLLCQVFFSTVSPSLSSFSSWSFYYFALCCTRLCFCSEKILYLFYSLSSLWILTAKLPCLMATSDDLTDNCEYKRVESVVEFIVEFRRLFVWFYRMKTQPVKFRLLVETH